MMEYYSKRNVAETSLSQTPAPVTKQSLMLNLEHATNLTKLPVNKIYPHKMIQFVINK